MFNWIQTVQTTLSSGSIYPLQQIDEPLPPIVPISVNYFPHRKCNYSCEFCFHTTKNLKMVPLDDAKRGLRLLAEAGMQKLNVSGGEPFLQPRFIGEILRYCKEELHLQSCSVVNNGSKVSEKWLDTYGQYLDVMAISCDSFDPEVCIRLGRAENGAGTHIPRVLEVADWCRVRGIKVKINSVITRYNLKEDMNEHIERIAPFRWKVFQMLLLDGENTGEADGSLRDARHLVISNEEFEVFVERHKAQQCLVPESNEAMKDSYLNLDEDMRFLNCQDGGKRPGRSLLAVGVQEALRDAGFDNDAFVDRGGIFDWSRECNEGENRDLEW